MIYSGTDFPGIILGTLIISFILQGYMAEKVTKNKEFQILCYLLGKGLHRLAHQVLLAMILDR